MAKVAWRSRIVGEADVAPGDLVPHPENWRRHPKTQQTALAGALSEVGWIQRVIVSQRSGRIIDGHARVELALSRNEPSVPVQYVDLTDDEERLALAFVDPLSAMAENDQGALDALLAQVQAQDAGLVAMLDGLRSPQPFVGNTDPDAIPIDVGSTSKPGDLWLLGDHRLLCGDSTKAEDVARLGGDPRIVFTSPPYLEQREYGGQSSGGWFDLMQGVAANFPRGAQVLVNLGLIHRDGRVARYWDAWIDALESDGWRLFGWYVWDKISATFKANDGRPYIAHEWVFHFNQDSAETREWVKTKHGGEQRGVWGQRKPDGHVPALGTPGRIKDFKPPDSIARIQRETNNSDASVRSHPARFPVAFAEYWIGSWGGDVYEPFSGSGTTLIACERLGRRCYAMEIEPKYVDVAVRRWEQFTGKNAVREAEAVSV